MNGTVKLVFSSERKQYTLQAVREGHDELQRRDATARLDAR